MRLAVATYLWQPDTGSKFSHRYTADDVFRLAGQVKKNTSVPHEFLVITDQPELFDVHNDGDLIRVVKIDKTTHINGTCYVRLMTFHPDGKQIFNADRVLQLDLDSLIVGNIDHLLAREEPVVLWRNPTWTPNRQGRAFYNSSMVLHQLGSAPEAWYEFCDNKRSGLYRGYPFPKDDQWYLSTCFGRGCPSFNGENDGVYRIAREDTPGSGVDGELPENACVVFFTGSDGKADNPLVRARNPWIGEYMV